MKELPPKPVSKLWKPELTRLPKLTGARIFFRAFARGLMKLIVKICLKVTVEGMENFPQKGPLMIVINHLGNADTPTLLSALPTLPDALGGIELYDLPILGKLMDWYGIIWLHRGRADTKALRAALNGFAEGRMIVIAPEGRYSLTGALEQGSGGAAFLAYKTDVPILPIALIGTENENVYGYLKRFQRAQVGIRVGRMFRLSESIRGRQEAVNLGTRKIMQALADLLPEKYRGAYSNPK